MMRLMTVFPVIVLLGTLTAESRGPGNLNGWYEATSDTSVPALCFTYDPALDRAHKWDRALLVEAQQAEGLLNCVALVTSYVMENNGKKYYRYVRSRKANSGNEALFVNVDLDLGFSRIILNRTVNKDGVLRIYLEPHP
jgi:hypothetical protein